MTCADNVKRRFRRGWVIIAFFVMCFLAGCGGPEFTSRAYPLGRYPETAKEIVDSIVTDQIRKHIDHDHNGRRLYKLVPEENYIIANTTSEGHRQIKASLKDLENE